MNAGIQSWCHLLCVITFTFLSFSIAITWILMYEVIVISYLVFDIKSLHIWFIHVGYMRIDRRENLIREICHLSWGVGFRIPSLNLEITILLLKAIPMFNIILSYYLMIYALVFGMLLRDRRLDLHHLNWTWTYDLIRAEVWIDSHRILITVPDLRWKYIIADLVLIN